MGMLYTRETQTRDVAAKLYDEKSSSYIFFNFKLLKIFEYYFYVRLISIKKG